MNQTTYRGKSITYDEAVQAMDRFDKEIRQGFPCWVRKNLGGEGH
jgi:hypothetical protein